MLSVLVRDRFIFDRADGSHQDFTIGAVEINPLINSNREPTVQRIAVWNPPD